MQIVDAERAVIRHARPYLRPPRPRTFLRGRGDRRACVGYLDIEGKVLTARTPTRPIIERMTQGNPRLRAAALHAAGCEVPAEVAGFLDDIGKGLSSAGNFIYDQGKKVVNAADDVAEKVTGERLVTAAINIGKDVLKVAKDVAYSPYFQAALVALPVPGTAAAAAAIRTVQTLEALARQAAAGKFEAKAALGLAKAGLQLKNATTPAEEAKAQDLVRQVEKAAKDAGIPVDDIKKAVNIAQTQAEKVLKGKVDVQKLVNDPNAVKKILAKAQKFAGTAKGEALRALADAIGAEQQQKKGKGMAPAQSGDFVRYALTRLPDGTIAPASKQRRDRMLQLGFSEKVYRQLKSPSVQNYRNAQLLERTKPLGRMLQKEREENARLKKLLKQTQENATNLRAKVQKLAAQIPKEANVEDARKITPRLAKIVRYVVQQGKQNDPNMLKQLRGGMRHYQQQAGIPETGKYDGATRGAMLHFGASNLPAPFDGSSTVTYRGPQSSGGGITRPPELEQAAAAKGKKLYMVQAPSRKVYPVAI